MSAASQQQQKSTTTTTDNSDDDNETMMTLDSDTTAIENRQPVAVERSAGTETGDVSGTSGSSVASKPMMVKSTGGRETGTDAGETSGTTADADADEGKPGIQRSTGGTESGTTNAAMDAHDDGGGTGISSGTGVNGDDSGTGVGGGTMSATGVPGGSSSSGVSVWDDVECKFNVNSYQMIFVVNTKSFLYRRHSLATARQVCNNDCNPGI